MSFDTFLENWKPPVREPQPPQEPIILKVGDILLANWGYEANNPHFFKVIKRTSKQVVVNQLKDQTVSYTNDGMGGKMVIPTDEIATWSVWRDDHSEKNMPVILRRKIKVVNYRGNDHEECIDISSYATAYKWDGKAAHDYNWH